jgi:hypothetical protein
LGLLRKSPPMLPLIIDTKFKRNNRCCFYLQNIWWWPIKCSITQGIFDWAWKPIKRKGILRTYTAWGVSWWSPCTNSIGLNSMFSSKASP